MRHRPAPSGVIVPLQGLEEGNQIILLLFRQTESEARVIEADHFLQRAR